MGLAVLRALGVAAAGRPRDWDKQSSLPILFVCLNIFTVLCLQVEGVLFSHSPWQPSGFPSDRRSGTSHSAKHLFASLGMLPYHSS